MCAHVHVPPELWGLRQEDCCQLSFKSKEQGDRITHPKLSLGICMQVWAYMVPDMHRNLTYIPHHGFEGSHPWLTDPGLFSFVSFFSLLVSLPFLYSSSILYAFRTFPLPSPVIFSTKYRSEST